MALSALLDGDRVAGFSGFSSAWPFIPSRRAASEKPGLNVE